MGSSPSGKDFGHTFEITGMVEKPLGNGALKSHHSGRYVLGPEIFSFSKRASRVPAAKFSSPTASRRSPGAKRFTACASMQDV